MTLRKRIDSWLSPPETISILVASCTPTDGVLFLDSEILEAWARDYYVDYDYVGGNLFYIGKARCYDEEGIVKMFASAYLRNELNRAKTPLARARAATAVLGAQGGYAAGPIITAIWHALLGIIEHLEAGSSDAV